MVLRRRRRSSSSKAAEAVKQPAWGEAAAPHPELLGVGRPRAAGRQGGLAILVRRAWGLAGVTRHPAGFKHRGRQGPAHAFQHSWTGARGLVGGGSPVGRQDCKGVAAHARQHSWSLVPGTPTSQQQQQQEQGPTHRLPTYQCHCMTQRAETPSQVSPMGSCQLLL